MYLTCKFIKKVILRNNGYFYTLKLIYPPNVITTFNTFHLGIEKLSPIYISKSNYMLSDLCLTEAHLAASCVPSQALTELGAWFNRIDLVLLLLYIISVYVLHTCYWQLTLTNLTNIRRSENCWIKPDVLDKFYIFMFATSVIIHRKESNEKYTFIRKSVWDRFSFGTKPQKEAFFRVISSV